MQKLLDFDVAIEPVGSHYRIRVMRSPAGEASADFVLPFTDKDLEILILKVIGSVGRVRRKVRRLQSEERWLLEEFGDQLFNAAFSGRVRECLERSRIAAGGRNASLRIRLRLPSALANIPWEYLHDAEYGFLGLSPETVVVRYMEMPAPVRPFAVSPPLRILTMISAPSDVPELQSEDEWGKLRSALADLIDRGMVEVDRLPAGTLAALQRPLRLHAYHVLHFVGHGVYDEDAQDGALALEGAHGRTRLVTGRDLGLMLRGHHSLRLVVLNACEGARNARDDPLGGIAQALVRQGIPAVIAMQFEISDPAALVFSQSFYQAIADGLAVDVAMVEARRAMFAEGHEVEWATPVLYMRSPDGRVFARGWASGTERKAREETERKAPEETERKAREATERKAREETERKAREETERKAREETERKAREVRPKLGDLLFGRGKARRGADVETEATLSANQAAYGTTISLRLTGEGPCSACRGTGAKPGTVPRVCPACRGTGQDSTGPTQATPGPCRTCRGRGLVVDDPCPACSGMGRAMSNRTLQARIPAGVKDGQRVRLTGKGAPGERGGPAGDLYVRVRLM
jgi:hypothetical protein